MSAYVTTEDCCSNCGSKLENAETARLNWQKEASELQRQLDQATSNQLQREVQLKKAIEERKEMIDRWQAMTTENASLRDERVQMEKALELAKPVLKACFVGNPPNPVAAQDAFETVREVLKQP